MCLAGFSLICMYMYAEKNQLDRNKGLTDPAPCKQAALRLEGANTRQWLTRNSNANICFVQAKAADSPHC